MKVTFDSFDEFADWVNIKYLAYEELRDENIQLEMDRLRLTDKIADLETEIDNLRSGKLGEFTPDMPKVFKKKATDGNQ